MNVTPGPMRVGIYNHFSLSKRAKPHAEVSRSKSETLFSRPVPPKFACGCEQHMRFVVYGKFTIDEMKPRSF